MLAFRGESPQALAALKCPALAALAQRRTNVLITLACAILKVCARPTDEAGRTAVLVNPRNTSKMCSNPNCGRLVEKDLSVRVHDCPHCGLVLDRDQNAAINILRLGLQNLRL